MNTNSSQTTEIETEKGTLYVDTETRENILVANNEPPTCVAVEGGTLYIDTETHESILVEDSGDLQTESSEDSESVVA